MQKFDCLKPETPLFGPHFLEASAGTGKTFAIEHVVARLILHGVELGQVLVVTFTRAAARELKLRIRANLETIAKTKRWSSLELDREGLHRVHDALAEFERAQIFTIHGFCQRMLGEQTGVSGALEPLEAALKDFFRFTLSTDLVCPEQLGVALQANGGVAGLAARLCTPQGTGQAKKFPESLAAFQELLASWPEPRDLDALQRAFELQRSACKATVKGDFQAQLRALSAGDAQGLGALIREKGSLFAFLGPENQRLKMKERPAPFPFFEWGQRQLLPLIQEAADPDNILHAIASAWKPIEQCVLEEEGASDPDRILRAMETAISQDDFCQRVRGAYRAVLIDEFQDTDPIQWNIFQTLFLNAEALYLIGDPKQSIYRFRSADLYTYLKAKEAIAPAHHFYLDTNFRSSKPLIDALNRLFDREWLHLPKLNQSLPFRAVNAGLELTADFGDSWKAVHCLKVDDLDPLNAYVGREIQRLRPFTANWSSFAVLVKDRYQSAAIEHVLSKAGVPSVAKSSEPLSASLAFCAVEELFAALADPRNLRKAKTVLAGPFGRLSAEALCKVTTSPIFELRALFNEVGLAQFFAHLRRRYAKEIMEQDSAFHADLCQTIEVLLTWEQTCGFTFDGLARHCDRLRTMTRDIPLRYKQSEVDGVQILTMHSSKGLEFDVVFALGVAAKSPIGDEEVDAEKLRQLYVTLTRAKRRLYLPIHSARGLHSPIELFCQHLAPDGQWELALRGIEEISFETVPNDIAVEPQTTALLPVEMPSPPEPQKWFTTPSYILSFTALASKEASAPLPQMPVDVKPLYTLHNMPRGPETGVILHAIFEQLFEERAWNARDRIETIIAQQLKNTALLPWQEPIIRCVQSTLDLRLPTGFCLRDIAFDAALVEAEFLFQQEPNFLKGFIDLLFIHNGKLYFVDWKTNWLGPTQEDYSLKNMDQAMRDHDYFLQAKIYREALMRVWDGPWGGAFYLFVRGPTVQYVNPETL